MEGTMLASICFTLVVVAMVFPALILMIWPDVSAQSEEAKHDVVQEPRRLPGA
jgi:hypothetical protein